MDNSSNSQIITLAESGWKYKARVRISKVYRDREEFHFEEDNLVVTTGKQIALHALYPTSLNDSLNYAKVGNGGSTNPPPGGDGSLLKTPTIGLLDLYSPIARVGITKISEDMTVPSITLMANLDNSQANGYFVNEAGFFSGTNLMFNIKVFPGIQKTWEFSVNFQWTISVL